MPIATFIAGGNGRADQRFFEMDCTTQITPMMDNKLTKHPVEAGSNITDHVVIENNRFSIEGVITNAPVFVAQKNILGETGKRTQIAYDALEELRNSRSTFTLVTEFKSYPNCVITSLTMEKDGTFDALKVKVDIEQIRVVRTEFVLFVAPEKVDDSTSTKHSGRGQTLTEVLSNSKVAEVFRDTSGD